MALIWHLYAEIKESQSFQIFVSPTTVVHPEYSPLKVKLKSRLLQWRWLKNDEQLEH